MGSQATAHPNEEWWDDVVNGEMVKHIIRPNPMEEQLWCNWNIHDPGPAWDSLPLLKNGGDGKLSPRTPQNPVIHPNQTDTRGTTHKKERIPILRGSHPKTYVYATARAYFQSEHTVRWT